MQAYRKLWFILIAILAVTFSLLGYYGTEIYRQAPPIPAQVVNADGKALFTRDDILDGQTAWQSVGGMQLGSIWGHGAYQAPDWTADWLHRELTAWLALAAQETHGQPYAALGASAQAGLREDLKREYRGNRVDPASGVLRVSERRAQAMAQTAVYYERLFSDAPELQKSREHFAMKENTLPSAERRVKLTQFFFWTAWAAATERPDTVVTYTNNWPHEPLIGNQPSAENIVWSIASIVVLLAGVGLLVWAWAFLRRHDEPLPAAAAQDPLRSFALTPSQHALGKYLFLIVALFVFQVMVGGLTAHYTVEGQQFYGIDLSQWFPYALTRTWHIQAALFWIATGFLAVGLFLAPLIHGGKDPKFQKLGVDILFWALVVVVAGSFIGNFLAIAQIMPPHLNFWLGHQGYEYVDLGRLWQIGKFAGIAFWLVLMLRGIAPALKRPGGDKNLLALLTASVVAIGLFYGAGLFYGERTHLTVMEYWRWWVVHLWVEGFFEVFATTALAFIFVTMGLVSRSMATTASLASASLFLLGGIPGTFHHLYFSGTTTPVMAVGASFSALEVVPLIVLGPRCLGELAPEGAGAVDGGTQMANDVFRRGGLLEHAGRGRVRLHDQPAAVAVLHPGAQHHAGACARRVVRGLWLSGSGLHAAGTALHPAALPLAPGSDAHCVLGAQRRIGADDFHQPVADWDHSVPRQRERGPVVRPQRSLHAAAPAANPALGAHVR